MTNRTYNGADYIVEPMSGDRLLAGVRTRRIIAFLIDAVLIALLTFGVGVLVFFLGIVTLGLGWLLYPILWPVVALVYCAFTMGGPNSATVGMRTQGLEVRFLDGSRMNPGIAAIHAVLFYASVSLLTPFIVLVALVSDRKRLLHDLVLGTIVVNRS
ncbi:RDD family protein [Oryzibacter oryziterrae]|uniref:RDD family protein n=1 Tax=Oryzibacter oryziterrae TaxID=2766474 RepID=UPI001F37FB44|nr:RDD family protein [Oryzibacter oryziterrae]